MTARNSIALIKNAIKVMENQQIFQWDSLYPTKADFLGDIQKQQLFVGLNNNDIAVIYALNKDSDTQYEKGNWKYPDSEYRVIQGKWNVLLLCAHIGIINLTKGNSKILERSVILWQQNQLICTQG